MSLKQRRHVLSLHIAAASFSYTSQISIFLIFLFKLFFKKKKPTQLQKQRAILVGFSCYEKSSLAAELRPIISILHTRVCRMPHAACRMPSASCARSSQYSSMPYVLCHMPYAICHMPYALCELRPIVFNSRVWSMMGDKSLRYEYRRQLAIWVQNVFSYQSLRYAR